MKLLPIICATLACSILTAHASTVSCPGAKEIEPFVAQIAKNLRPVPFPQCYYTAEPTEADNINRCDQLYDNISNNLLQKKNIEIKNWNCSFISNDKQDNQYKYAFTFLAVYK